jgi:hypothetical protein
MRYGKSRERIIFESGRFRALMLAQRILERVRVEPESFADGSQLLDGRLAQIHPYKARRVGYQFAKVPDGELFFDRFPISPHTAGDGDCIEFIERMSHPN